MGKPLPWMLAILLAACGPPDRARLSQPAEAPVRAFIDLGQSVYTIGGRTSDTVLLAPYLVFIERSGGVYTYFRQASEWAARDRERAPVEWPGLVDYPSGVSDDARSGAAVERVVAARKGCPVMVPAEGLDQPGRPAALSRATRAV